MYKRQLLLAAVLSLIIGFFHKDFTESVGISCAIILATCVGFWFEWDAQRSFRRLNQVNDDKMCIRDSSTSATVY